MAPLHPALAQTLEDIQPRSQGGVQGLSLRFSATVRLVQMLPPGPADHYTLRFEMLSADDNVLRLAVPEFRRVPADGARPDLTVTYTPEPGQRIQQLNIELGRAASLQARPGADSRTIDLVLASPGPAASSAPAAPAAAAASAAAAPAPRLAVELETLPLSERDRMKPVPIGLQGAEVTINERVIDGVPSLQVLVGYFATQAEAEAARQLALPRFPQARVVDMNAQQRAQAPAAPASAAAPHDDPGLAVDAAQPAVEHEAAGLMATARQALDARRGEEAVAALNPLLNLPPNSQSQRAQELIGNAWELVDDPRRARTEYELYLKLYPQGEGAARVRARLLALLGPAATVTAGPTPTVVAPKEAPRIWSGTLAQYYYGGKARSKSLVTLDIGIDQSTVSRTTESSIVTSLDLTGRLSDGQNETRAVVRGSGATNLLSTGHSSSTIGSAYVEHRRGPDGLALRVGRQSPISGGLLGLFDGVSLATPVGGGLKLDVMGGVPASTLVSAPAEKLFAAVLEADTLAERWGGNMYLLTQTTEGITNRRAFGAELRYAGERGSLNTLIDYDSLFKAWNAVSVHGSFQAGAQTTVTMLVDERRAPSLQLTNALISSGAASLKTLLQTRTLEQVRADALATSAIARQYLLSISRPINARWQAAADLSYSAIGALPAVGDFEATPATGGQYSLSLQMTGTNLYSKHDVNNVNLGVISTPFFHGVQIAYNNLTGVDADKDITVEPSIRLYTQRDQQGVKLTRIGPGLRLSYRATRRASLLTEMLYENSRTDGPSNHDNTDSVFFYVGYRYELF